MTDTSTPMVFSAWVNRQAVPPQCGCRQTQAGIVYIVYCALHGAAPALIEALREIAKGKGAYSRDPLTHAKNTIDNMKEIASDAIAKATS